MQGENRMAKIEILELDSISEKEYTTYSMCYKI